MKVTFEGTRAEIIDDMRWFLIEHEPITETKQTYTQFIESQQVDPVDDTIDLPDDAPLPPSNDPEVDVDGVRWNAEDHASTKTKTKDGRWKKRKGSGTSTVEPPPPGPTVRNYPSEIMAECSRLLQSGADLPAISLEGMNVAGFSSQAEIWQADAPTTKLEAYLAHLKSK